MSSSSVIAAFDFDHTLTNRDSLLPFLIRFKGTVYTATHLLRLGPTFLLFLLGSLSRQRTKVLLRGANHDSGRQRGHAEREPRHGIGHEGGGRLHRKPSLSQAFGLWLLDEFFFVSRPRRPVGLTLATPLEWSQKKAPNRSWRLSQSRRSSERRRRRYAGLS